MTTVLIDYGSGNLRSAEKALLKAAGGGGVVVSADPQVVAKAERLVLPGVGAFAACMGAVEAIPGLHAALDEAVKRRGAPFLGICVGAQLVASRGLEFGETAGLGWIAGDVKRIAPSEPRFKVPHMGWNTLSVKPHKLFEGLGDAPEVYFTHSFAIFPAGEADVIATTDHGGAVTAAVARDNVAGVQFHPEKSQAAGLRLLANFLEWRP